MAFINDITITITRGTLGLEQRSFDPLILGSGAVAATGITDATDLTDVTTAGYLTTDAEYLMASAMFAQTPRPEIVRIYRKATATAYADALTTLRTIDDSWYTVNIDSHVISDLNAVGTWANSNKKYFIGCVNDITAGSGRNVDREAYLIHDQPTDYPDCAWVGQNIPKQPGSFTWKWKILSGQEASAYTTTQLNTIRTNHTQALQEQADAIFVNEGQATSGEYIDVIMGQDWVEDELNTAILDLFIKNEKVALDDVGIAQVEGKVRDVLKRAGDYGIIARSESDADLLLSDDKKYMYQVTVPLRADISSVNKSNRTLPDVKFVYYLAGAIHKTTVTGLITV
jgi:hypothetical protein